MNHPTKTPPALTLKTHFQNLPNLVRLVVLGLLSILHPHLSTVFAQGTAFTYQGRFHDGASPANGVYDFTFALFSLSSGVGQVGSTLTHTATVVSNGGFTVPLDFGGGAFPGADRWLEISVRTNDGGAVTVLAPRQPLTPTPYAITASNLSGTLPASQLSGPVASDNFAGTYSNALTLSNAANSFSGSGAGLTALNASELTRGTVPDALLAANVARTNQVWLLSGNADTSPGPHFLGTTDNQALEIKVNGTRALRLEPTVNDAEHSNIVNVVGGSSVNFVGTGVYGATISGGGASSYFDFAYTNRVEADFGTVSGGLENTIQPNSRYAAIGGGVFNTIQSNASFATIGGGGENTIQTDSRYAAIGGGFFNTIQSNASFATIGGGYQNTIRPNAGYATIGGGGRNTIQPNSRYAAIGGGVFNTIQSNASFATIGGGYQNTIHPNAADSYATISGGGLNTIQSNAYNATISGGYQNTMQTNADNATIGGGELNTIETNAFHATIGGGRQNTIKANAVHATIPGGYLNSAASYAFAAGNRAQANHTGAFVWADSTQVAFASTAPDQFCIRANGGVQLSGDTDVSFGSTLGQKLNLYGTAFGIGIQNGVQYSRVGVGGGWAWYAGGVHHNGTYEPGAGGALVMRLDGNGNLFTAGAVNPPSDRNAKENFAPVRPREVLAKVVALPLTSWNYKADPATRHVGPVAQDFYAAFNLGADDKHIATVDADGVALAAIQGLNQKLEDQGEELEQKQKEIVELKLRLEKVEQLLNLKAK